MNRRFLIVLSPAEPDEDPGYTETVPELPGCFTEGGSLEEALDRAREAIELFTEVMQVDGRQLPERPQTIDATSLESDNW